VPGSGAGRTGSTGASWRAFAPDLPPTGDGHAAPIPHFGAILPPDRFWDFAGRLRAAGIGFVMEPALRFAGKPGEQATMFFLDPDGNALEFKAFMRPLGKH
jgi:extradiol dioxygenase family protein